MRVEFRAIQWPLTVPFRTAARAVSEVSAVRVDLHEDGVSGRGEAAGVFYHGETTDSMLVQMESIRSHLLGGLSRDTLQGLLPAGGARNAIDCALWDLEAKRSGRRSWDIAGIHSVSPLTTAFTLSTGTAEAMAQAAAGARHFSLLKLKLNGERDVERVAAVRAARPDAELIVDANQSWTTRHLYDCIPQLESLDVKLIEQPLRAGDDEALSSFKSPIPICADESCQTVQSLGHVVGKYQYVNIKLDKAGGLTEALHLAREAARRDLNLMVGCMVGSSLSMAPAFIIGQLCSVVDLDGPLLCAADVPDAIRYEGSRMFAPEPSLWG